MVDTVESLLAGDLDLRAALTMAEAYDWTARWREASIRLVAGGRPNGKLDTIVGHSA